MALVAAAALLMLGGTGGAAIARPGGGGFHGGGFGGGFHGGGFHGGGFRGGGFHGGGFHGGGFGGDFHGGGFHGGGFHGGGFDHGFHGYHGFGGYGPGWGPWWGLGAYLPILPWYYSTFWWDGVPYYFVDNDYYVWDSDAGQYEQVQPPPQVAQQAQSGAGQTLPQLFAYPKNGQTPQQQARDKRECGSWASAQTGFIPASGAVATAPSAPTRLQQGQNYLRAEGACLEARGYSVE